MKLLVNGYLDDGDIAPQIIFYNGPGSSAYTAARHSLYGWGWTPTFQVDGVHQQIGWSPSTIKDYIDSRLAVPSHVSIVVVVSGTLWGGTAYYAITAEQDLGVSGEIKVWSAILEDHDIATSAYGVYNGQELMWEPRAWPLGSSGTPITFTGPYPETVNVQGDYILDPGQHTFENLNVITYVQCSTGNKECLNASFIDLPDAVGVEDPGGPGVSSLLVSAWPNPCSGCVTVASSLPEQGSGQIRILDLSGRCVASFEAGGQTQVQIEQQGVYFARLETSAGEAVTTRFTVVN
ncbi:T9SS type A sorting domain-containing protein [Candidatus Fermentibacterales bacterium]|nr:T9SS type A sorting domain-containing protein [Candidatus Fermentibacterales bacterium]